jgi:hypothetical protein
MLPFGVVWVCHMTEQVVRVLEKRVLAPKEKEVTGDWRELYIGLQNLYS